jgi:hypothetical protein
MLDIKNKQIIDTLTEVTKSGDLVWIETDPTFYVWCRSNYSGDISNNR